MSRKEKDISIISTLAPEDIQPGMFIAVHKITEEHLPYSCFEDRSLSDHEKPLRMTWLPDNSGVPYKVKSVCIPYVYATTAIGKPRIFDLRRHRLVRLDPDFGRMVWQGLKKARNVKKKKSKDDD